VLAQEKYIFFLNSALNLIANIITVRLLTFANTASNFINI